MKGIHYNTYTDTLVVKLKRKVMMSMNWMDEHIVLYFDKDNDLVQVSYRHIGKKILEKIQGAV
jgi:hypothetical protein